MRPFRVAGLAGLLLAASLVPTTAALAAGKHHEPIPPEVAQQHYKKGRPCHVDTAHHRVRVWWTEHHVPDRLPGSDGRCSTRPHYAALVIRNAERMLNVEHGFGLPRPSADGWLGSDNGGSGALDVYLGGAYAGGLTQCRSESALHKTRTAAYVMIAIPANIPTDLDSDYLAVVAHEFTHVAQCAVHNKRGASANNAGPWIVEGTANMIAAAVDPKSQGLPGLYGLWPVLDSFPVNAVGDLPKRPWFGIGDYNTWPFWYALTDGARSMHRLLALYRRVLSVRYSPHGETEIAAMRHLFPAAALQRALLAAARFDAFGGRLVNIHVPYDYWWLWRDHGVVTPALRLSHVAAEPSSRTVTVPAGGVEFVRVRPEDPHNATLAITVAGTNSVGRALRSDGVLVGDMKGRVVAPSAPGHWQAPVWPRPTFHTPKSELGAEWTGDAEAWVVFANAGSHDAEFRVTATATSG